jgi:hypothetical protein
MSAVLTTTRATMKISDLQTGFRILSRLPLANSHQAQLEINNFLDSMLQAAATGRCLPATPRADPDFPVLHRGTAGPRVRRQGLATK